jgi:hypothetical protein
MKGSNMKDDVQKMSNATLDATNHSFERVTKGTQAIVSELADYSKRSFENGNKTLESLAGARSLDKAIEVQTEYAKRALMRTTSRPPEKWESSTSISPKKS